MSSRVTVDTLLFDGVELLDVAGPVELFSHVAGIDQVYVGATRGPVVSAQGLSVVAGTLPDELDSLDVLLVPGGPGTRRLVADADLLSMVRGLAAVSSRVASVCTGAALLASAGLLDGYRATSNKKAFRWVESVSSEVTWVPEARWVHDRDRWTSSGVAAGIDMAHALAADLVGSEAAGDAARLIEYEASGDAEHDPFAEFYGLVP